MPATAPRPPRLRILLPLALSLFLAACSKPAPPAAEVRPVRAMTLAPGKVGSSAEFSGDVRPRYESRLGFRVGGKISARKVDVGSVVRRGTLLMQLDPQDLRLGQAQAQAALRTAETTLELAQAELKRYQGLRGQNFVSQAVLDEKLAAARSAQSSVESNRAALREQSNQAGYASLVSDSDGVVTAIDAEVGQVVAAGTPVVRVARTDEKEVVIGVPEDQVGALRKVSDIKVTLWADPDTSIRGHIREVSPMADPATRTYTVKVAVPPREDVRLGMSAVVQLVQGGSAGAGAQLRVPPSALYQDKGVTSVWVIENGAVRLVPVQVGGVADNDVVLKGGVQAGQVVVTAGVNLLKNGQKVRVLTADVARRGDAEAEAAGKTEAPVAPARAAELPAAPATSSTAAAPATATGASAPGATVAGAAAVAGTAALAARAAPKAADRKVDQQAANKDSGKDRGKDRGKDQHKDSRKERRKASAERHKQSGKHNDKATGKTAPKHAHARAAAHAGAAK